MFFLLLQNPPAKPRPKSLQLGDRRLTLSLYQGPSSQLSLSNPLSPLPASPQPEHTPRSSSMWHTALHGIILCEIITEKQKVILLLKASFRSNQVTLTDTAVLKSFYFHFSMVGYLSLLNENDTNTTDAPGTPPPMPPKRHPHEIDNLGLISSEVHMLAKNSSPALLHI